MPRRASRFRTKQVDIVKADNRSAEFRGKNPLGTLPLLELDDGTYIAESVAICRYFEELHPDPPLMGTDARDRALVEMWQRRMELELFVPITQVFRNSHPFFAGRIPQVADYGEVCRAAAEARLAWLDTVLADREFIAGDALHDRRHHRAVRHRLRPRQQDPHRRPSRPIWRAGTRPCQLGPAPRRSLRPRASCRGSGGSRLIRRGGGW